MRRRRRSLMMRAAAGSVLVAGVISVALSASGRAVSPSAKPPSSRTYLLSAAIEGPAQARLSARDELRPRDGALPPPLRLPREVVPVATVGSLGAAWAWVLRALFQEIPPPAATTPGLHELDRLPVLERALKSGARVAAVSVHGLDDLSNQQRASTTTLGELADAAPESVTVAQPLASRIVVSKKPSPRLEAPQSSDLSLGERASLVVLSHHDQCGTDAVSGARSCLRWNTVLAEEDGLIIAGYLPAFLMATQNDWTCDRRDNCVQISMIGASAGLAILQVVLVNQRAQWATVQVPMASASTPALQARVTRGDLHLTLADASTRTIGRGDFYPVPDALHADLRTLAGLDVVLDAQDK